MKTVIFIVDYAPGYAGDYRGIGIFMGSPGCDSLLATVEPNSLRGSCFDGMKIFRENIHKIFPKNNFLNFLYNNTRTTSSGDC